MLEAARVVHTAGSMLGMMWSAFATTHGLAHMTAARQRLREMLKEAKEERTAENTI